MVAHPITQPTIKPYHFLALAKAIAAADLDLAEGRPAAGWRTGTDVHGWLVADQLVEVGYFERNIHGQSHKDDLNAQRYRITAAGRAAYCPDPAEAAILTKLKAALDAGRFGGWCYWQELTDGDWLPCDQLVGKGWIKPKTTPGKPQTRGIGNRAYRLEDEGCRVLESFNQKEAIMSASENVLGVGRYIDPETGEILEVSDTPPGDPVPTDVHNVYTERIAVVDPETVIANLQSDLQNALRDKFEAERQRDHAKQALEQATKLPNPGEYRQLQQLAEERRVEINRLTLRVNEAETNGWKGKHEKLLRSYQQLEDEVKALRQPDLEMGAKLTALTEERDQLLQQVDHLQSQLDTQPVIDGDAEPGIQTDFFVGVISHADTAARISQKQQQGWEFVYEVIHPDGRYNARIRRDTRTPDPIDAAIERALKTPRSDHIAEPDQMVILGLDNDGASLALSGQPLTPVPTFAQITQVLVNSDIDVDQFALFADAQAHHAIRAVQP